MHSRHTPARQDPDSEPGTPTASASPGISSRTAANLSRKPAPGKQKKAGFSLFSSAGKASLTAPASRAGVKLPARQKVTPANLRLGLMIGAALLLGALSIYVNTSAQAPSAPITGAALGGNPGTPTGLPPAQNGAGTMVVAGTPPLPKTPGAASPVSSQTVASGTVASTAVTGTAVTGAAFAPPPTLSTPPGTSPSKTVATVTQKPGSTHAAPGKVTPGPDVLVSPDPAIPDVFSAAQADGASQSRTPGTTPQGVSTTTGRAPAVLQGVPLAAAIQTVPVAAAMPLSVQTAPPVFPAPVRMVTTQPAPLLQVRLHPLPAPITALPAALSPVTLTRPGLPAAAQPTQVTRGPVTLVGIADGDTPTAILDTPAGQLMAAVGESVDVQGVPYTLTRIDKAAVILTHAQDRLTLTETP